MEGLRRMWKEMNEDIKQLKKQYHVTYDDISEYIGLSADYIKHIMNKDLSQEKRELIINAIKALKKEKIQNYVKQSNTYR